MRIHLNRMFLWSYTVNRKIRLCICAQPTTFRYVFRMVLFDKLIDVKKTICWNALCIYCKDDRCEMCAMHPTDDVWELYMLACELWTCCMYAWLRHIWCVGCVWELMGADYMNIVIEGQSRSIVWNWNIRIYVIYVMYFE